VPSSARVRKFQLTNKTAAKESLKTISPKIIFTSNFFVFKPIQRDTKQPHYRQKNEPHCP
jgi:hypothetical protein